ncbi:hypothetical protein FH972_022050 [Carpinus fangiana]|uniref:Carboxylic ester hydrolase n=1 Tax=Carpinus fangiana TaxID=176857 RepID=A0A5N6KRR4_9ROSI|nr:hypothetical protein FH972_022050 [Carpinus fangiana]
MLFSTLILGACVTLVLGTKPKHQPPAEPCRTSQPTATIDIGVLHGTQTSLSYANAPVNKFLGVPYAQSPPIRFSPPSAPKKLARGSPLNVTAWKPACIQQFVYPALQQAFTKGVFNQPPPQESEDCLYINIYAPSTPSPAGGRAVLFWLFGGGLQFGHGGQPAYDGSAFAAYQDVIVVTFNYRTNVFGFPNSPQITGGDSNPGFLDQHFALEWVQRNIHAFGGNKDKVTIFGESAGALSADSLITSPAYVNKGAAPFRAAILQSGQFSYNSQPLPTQSESVVGWDTLVQKLNCSSSHSGDDLACARAAPALTIKKIVEENALSFATRPDSFTSVDNSALARQSGKFVKVPVLGGTDAQEGRVFEFGQSNLTSYLQSTFGKTAPQIIPSLQKAFAVGTEAGINTGYDRISEIFTLLTFQCGQALWANATFAQDVPTWRYYYNSSFPNIAFADNSGVYHSSEIQTVFETYSGGPIFPITPGQLGLLNTQKPPTAQQAALSSYMNAAWATFAKNPFAGPGWNRLGSFNGTDLGVLGGAMGQAGVTVIRQDQVDNKCRLLLPQFNAANPGVALPTKV